jgi:hypothetical protein
MAARADDVGESLLGTGLRRKTSRALGLVRKLWMRLDQGALLVIRQVHGDGRHGVNQPLHTDERPAAT